VSNIEKRFSSGGGTPDHTPAVASPRGRSSQVHGKQEGETGINTPHHAEKIGEQTPQVSYEMLLQKPNAHRLTYGMSGNGNAEGIRKAAISWQGQWDREGARVRIGCTSCFCSNLSAFPGCISLAKEGRMESLKPIKAQHFYCAAVACRLARSHNSNCRRMAEIRLCRL